MKNAIILHGTGSTPDSHWLPAIGKALIRGGHHVWAPQLPDADSTAPDILLSFVLEKADLK